MFPQKVEEVFIKIQGKIINGEYLPGQPLPEILLAEEYQIKRTRIRQILQQLENINFVERIPGKGSFVKTITTEDLRDLFEMRESLEGIAAKLAARRRDENKINETLDFYKNFDLLGNEKNLSSWFNCAAKFHDFVLESCQNKLIAKTMFLLMLQIKRLWRDGTNIPGRFDIAFNEHKSILNAIKNKDEEKAEALMRKHVYEAFQMFVKDLLAK